MRRILKSLAVVVCLSCMVGCASPDSDDDLISFIVDSRVVRVVGSKYNIVDGGLYVGDCFIPSSDLSLEFNNLITVRNGQVYLDYFTF